MLLGIDIGTTGVRAAVFTPEGVLVADASLSCPHDAPNPGWAEAEPEAWWKTTQRLLADLATRTKLADVTCIAVTGQAPTSVLIDASGAVLRPAILWLDTRADAEAQELSTRAYYSAPKLLWLERHEPSLVDQTKHVLQSHAFLAYRLTGEVAIDPSTSSLHWGPASPNALGKFLGKVPPERKAHEILGEVTAEAAKLTGLAVGTPVVVGGGDFAAATLGAGVIEEGEACLMLGTAGNLLVPLKERGTDPRLINSHHVGVDRWLSLGGTLSGGAQEWLRLALSRGAVAEDDTAVRSALPTHEALDADAARVPAGSEGLLFLPYLQGERTPIWDVNARGAFVGLGLAHARGHLWRALLEGIALGFVDCQQVIEESSAMKLREVIAANGGGKSALFRQILCDALGVPLSYTPKGGGTVAGAAILAGLGSGALSSASDARAWRGEQIRHEPDAAAHARYRELLALRRESYEGLKGVFAKLNPG